MSLSTINCVYLFIHSFIALLVFGNEHSFKCNNYINISYHFGYHYNIYGKLCYTALVLIKCTVI